MKAKLLVLGLITSLALAVTPAAFAKHKREVVRTADGRQIVVTPTGGNHVRNYGYGYGYRPYGYSGSNVSIGIGFGLPLYGGYYGGYPGYYGGAYYPYASSYYGGGYYNSYPYGGYYGSYPYGYTRNYTTGYGYNGSVVARVQQRLAREGYYHGSIDGVMGPRTRYAIRVYERSHGLPADGVIDHRLLATMGIA